MADSEPTPATGGAGPDDSEAALQRTHPAGIIILAVRVVWSIALPILGLVVFGSLNEGGSRLASLGIAGVFVLVALIGGIGAWLSWTRFRYGVVGRDLVIRSGVIVRHRKAIPVGRIHGIDIKADVLMRLLGLVEITVQTAGGGANEPEAKITGIPMAEAERLRAALLHDRRVPAAATEDGAAAPGRPAAPAVGADPLGRLGDLRGVLAGAEQDRREASFEYKLPLPRLLLAGLTSNQVGYIFLGIIGVAAQGIEVFGLNVFENAASRAAALAIPALVAFAFLAILGVLAVAVMVTFVGDYGFTARRVDDRIETEKGLLERRIIGLPVGRIQAVRVEQAALRRPLHMVAVHVDTAGFGRSEDNGKGSAPVIPMALRGELLPLLHGLLPELDTRPDPRPLPRRALRRYLFLPLAVTVLLVAVAIAITPWGWSGLAIVAIVAGVAYLSFVSAGVAFDERLLVIASGVVGRREVRIPRTRIQYLSVSQNPFQKRARLATLAAYSISGSSKAAYRVRHMDAGDADAIMAWYRAGNAVHAGAPAAAVTEHTAQEPSGGPAGSTLPD